MLAWLRTPRGSVATAIAVVVILAALWSVQRSPLHVAPPTVSGPPSSEPQPLAALSPGDNRAASASQPDAQPAADTSATRTAATPPAGPQNLPQQQTIAAAGGGQAVVPGQTVASQSASLPVPATPAADAKTASLPAFDIVRVEPSGDAVIAGRAEPGSTVDLVDDGNVVAHVTVDGSGQFALLPPRLGEGSHYLTLQSGQAGRAAVISTQGVAVSIAKGGTDRPLVALLSPDQPVRVLSDGAPIVAPAAAKATPAPSSVAIQTVEAAQGGQFTASGVAKAGNQCRVYLNGAFLADVTAGKDGRWSVRIEKGMRPGKYTVRADEVEASTGKVVNRAEVPFDYPAIAEADAGSARNLLKTQRPMAVAVLPQTSTSTPIRTAANESQTGTNDAGGPGAAAPVPAGSKAAAAVVPDLQTAKVIRGDSLWRISRKMLGHGVNYTEIYASNATQIRDPRLIYPGQIFVVPNKAVN